MGLPGKYDAGRLEQNTVYGSDEGTSLKSNGEGWSFFFFFCQWIYNSNMLCDKSAVFRTVAPFSASAELNALMSRIAM